MAQKQARNHENSFKRDDRLSSPNSTKKCRVVDTFRCAIAEVRISPTASALGVNSPLHYKSVLPFDKMTTKQDDEESVVATDRDVIVGDQTNSSLANRLLLDLIAIHCQLGSKSTETSLRMVHLMQRGMPTSHFLQGNGNFIKVDGSSSTVASESEAVQFCNELMEEEAKTPLIETKLSGQDEISPTLENVRRYGQPGVYDVKIMSSTVDSEEDFSEHLGNIRFKKLLEKCTSKICVTSPHSTRVNAALSTLRKTEFVGKSDKAHFMIQTTSLKTWRVLDEREAAEYVMACVFDKLLGLPSASSTLDIHTLIPSIGTAEISQFVAYNKPATSPIEGEPTEYDVLFGRGGMTNNHTGNRRFRDIISLHRPDYVRAIKIEKPNVARRIVAAIRSGNPPGRFLKRNPNTQLWFDVGNRHATEKTSQALREKSNTEKNGNEAAPSPGDIRKRLLEQALQEAHATRLRLTREIGVTVGNGVLDQAALTLIVPVLYPSVVPAVVALPPKVANTTVKKNEKSSQRKMNSPQVMINETKSYDSKDSAGQSSSLGVLDSNGDILVTENDILCGRGGLTNHHKGNKRFRDIVALHRPDYVRATKVQKPSVARMIVKAIRNSDPPGRFLRKDETLGKWVDIGDKRAAEKASQALREKTSEEKRDSDRKEREHEQNPINVLPKTSEFLGNDKGMEKISGRVESSNMKQEHSKKRKASPTEEHMSDKNDNSTPILV